MIGRMKCYIAEKLASASRTSLIGRILQHPYIFVLSCVAVLIDALFWLIGETQADTLTVTIFVIYGFVLLLLAVNPERISIVAIAYWAICIMLPNADASPMLIGICVAMGVMFAECRIKTALVTVTVSTAVLIVAVSLENGDSWQAALAIVIFQAAFSIAGYALRRHREELLHKESESQLTRSMEQVSHLKRDMRIASRLHDTLANDLSSVTMIAHTALASSEPLSKDEKQRWNNVIMSVNDALEQSHEVISILEGQPVAVVDDTSTQDIVSVESMIKSVIAKQTSYLEQLGFSGRYMVAQIPSEEFELTRELSSETMGLITEIFTNLRRHCDPRVDTYTLHVEFTKSGIELTQMNSVSPTTSQETGSRSGKGLSLHRKLLQSSGGTLKTSMEDSTWTLFAQIPWTSTYA